MAKRSIVHITDDLDGGADAETVTFAYQGQRYEIDLTDANREKFEALLEPYVSAGRKAPASGRQQRGTRRARSGTSDLAAVRTWAEENGYTVNSRGRISQAVMDAYSAAN